MPKKIITQETSLPSVPKEGNQFDKEAFFKGIAKANESRPRPTGPSIEDQEARIERLQDAAGKSTTQADFITGPGIYPKDKSDPNNNQTGRMERPLNPKPNYKDHRISDARTDLKPPLGAAEFPDTTMPPEVKAWAEAVSQRVAERQADEADKDLGVDYRTESW